MRLRIFVFGFVMLIMTKTNAQQDTAGTLTLQQCIETAIKNNIEVKRSEFDMQRAAVNHRQAKGDLLPDLNANINHGINQGRSIDPFTNSYINQQINFASYNLSTGVTIFNGFQLLNTLKQQALNYDAAKAELQLAKDNITLRVILAYLQALNAEDQLTQAMNQAHLSRQQVERLERMNQQGAIAPSLLSDLKGQFARDELAIVDARNSQQSAKLALAQLMNVPYSVSMKIERLSADQMAMVYDGDVESIYRTATDQLAIMRSVDLRRRAAEKGVKAARGGYTPLIFVSANLNTNYSSAARTETLLSVTDVPTNNYIVVNGNKFNVFSPEGSYSTQKISYSDQFRNNYSTSVAVGVRIPIVNALFARNQVARAKIDLRSAQFTAQSTMVQLRQDIEAAYFNMKAAQDRYRALVDQVTAFQESFRIAEVRFNAGLGTSVDYLLARNNFDRANIQLVTARYDYVLRTKVLDYYQNKSMW